MTEKEKMLSGQPYLPSDKELDAARLRARSLLSDLAKIPMTDEADRKRIFRELFAETGEDFLIESPFTCDYGFNVYWGENAYANFNCVFLDSAPIHIGANVMLAPGVMLLTVNHPLKYKERNTGYEYAKPIVVGDNVWIGGGAIVNPGVTIGQNSVIGSGSVVTKDIPANVVAVGNPCRVVKKIDNEL